MNTDIVKELRWLSENDEWVFAAETMAKAADLIESLQAQLAEARRRERAAVESLAEYRFCVDCKHGSPKHR